MKLSFPAFLAMATAAVATASEMPPFSAVFGMSNSENNEVIVWSRDTETGELEYEGSVATGGSGGSIAGPNAQMQPTVPNAPDPMASQDPMVVAGRCLIAVNEGSDTVSSLKIFGPRKVSLAGVYPTNGRIPVSVAAVDDLVYVLNAGFNGSFQGYRLNKDNCSMQAIGDTIELAQTVPVPILPDTPEIPFGPFSPAQIGFTPKGDILVTIKGNGGFAAANPENPGFGTINHYKIGLDGTTSADALTVTTPPRVLSAPFAFDFDDEGVLLLNEAFIINGFPASPGGVSFWEENDGAYTEIAPLVSVEQGFSCWIRWNPVNKCMYITNSFADGSISSVRAGGGGDYELVESVAAGLNGPLDLVFSADSKYMYVYSPGFLPSPFGNGNPYMGVYEMASDCSLTLVEEETDGYEAVATRPLTTNPTGVAIFPDFNQVSGGGEGMAPPKGLVEAIRSGAIQLRK